MNDLSDKLKKIKQVAKSHTLTPMEAKGICEVIVRKNRQGSIGMVPMTFLGDYCVFEPFYGEMPREEQKQGRGMKWN